MAFLLIFGRAAARGSRTDESGLNRYPAAKQLSMNNQDENKKWK